VRIGVPAGAPCAFEGRSCRAARGVIRRSFEFVGKRRMPLAPRTIDGRYWNRLMLSSESSGESGLGPFGFGPTPSPFAASQTSVRCRGVASTSTG
jgi:hypothetical protein